MAHIRGPLNGHADLTGSSADDLILAFGNLNTITGGGGDDTISAISGSSRNQIFEGSASDGLTALNEIIRLDGRFDSVSGGDENFRISGYVSDSKIDLGRGNNTISLNGAGDTVSVIGGQNHISVLDGHATVLVTGQSASGYVDDVVVSGAHNTVENSLGYGPYPADGTVNIHGGSGYGSFNMGTASGTVVTQGAHNFIFAGSEGARIVAGSGHDTVEISGGAGFFGGGAKITLAGEHNDVFGEGGSSTIVGGAGHDTINLTGNYEAAFKIYEGGIGNSISLTSTAQSTITPGTGSDTVSVDGGLATMTFHGSGNALYLSGETNYAGYPVSTVTDQSSGLHIFLEATDHIPGNPPSNGNLQITDFDAKGVISFEGGRGGFTSAAQVVSDLHSTGNGRYSLVLPDGSGTITFLHTGSLSAANFHV